MHLTYGLVDERKMSIVAWNFVHKPPLIIAFLDRKITSYFNSQPFTPDRFQINQHFKAMTP